MRCFSMKRQDKFARGLARTVSKLVDVKCKNCK